MSAEQVGQAEDQSRDLLQKYGDHELEFMGARATLRELMAMCPVPVEERSFDANQKMMAKALVMSSVALPEEYHHWLEPELQDQARANLEVAQQEADRAESVAVSEPHDKVEREVNSSWYSQPEAESILKPALLVPEQVRANAPGRSAVIESETAEEDWWLQRAQLEARILADNDEADDKNEQVTEQQTEDSLAEERASDIVDSPASLPQPTLEVPAEPVLKGEVEPVHFIAAKEAPIASPTPEVHIETPRDLFEPAPQPTEGIVQEAKRALGIEPTILPAPTEPESAFVQEPAVRQAEPELIESVPDSPQVMTSEVVPPVVVATEASYTEREPTASSEATLNLETVKSDTFYVRGTEVIPEEPQPELALADGSEIAEADLTKPIAAVEQMPDFIQASLAVFKETADTDEVVMAETQTIKVEQSVAAFVEVLEALPESDAEEPAAIIEAELAVAAAYDTLLEMIGIDDKQERQELVEAYITTIRQQVVARQEALALAGQQSQLDRIQHLFIEDSEIINADPAATPFTQNLARIIQKFTRLLGQLTVRSVEA